MSVGKDLDSSKRLPKGRIRTLPFPCLSLVFFFFFFFFFLSLLIIFFLITFFQPPPTGTSTPKITDCFAFCSYSSVRVGRCTTAELACWHVTQCELSPFDSYENRGHVTSLTVALQIALLASSPYPTIASVPIEKTSGVVLLRTEHRTAPRGCRRQSKGDEQVTVRCCGAT